MISYPLIWLVIIAFIIIMYIILDGFTLGVGLLFPWVRNSKDRDTMITTVLPVWDGNETWLVFAGAALYAGFPEAFGVLMSALYLPIMVLIVGLLFRGVSFEFIHKASKSVHVWEKCFFIGSLMAVVAQGLVVGSYVQGFIPDPSNGDIAVRHLFNWFNLFCILALIVGYTLLGSARLLKKTRGELRLRFFTISKMFQWFLLLAILFISFYSPYTGKSESGLWLHLHNLVYKAIFAAGIIILVLIHALALKRRSEKLPFITLVGIYGLSYIGFITSNLPYIVPYQLTFIQARVDDGAYILMLGGVAILLPLLLFYTAYAYHIFGGKVDEKTHY